MLNVLHTLDIEQSRQVIGDALNHAQTAGTPPPSYRDVVASLRLTDAQWVPAHFRRIYFEMRVGSGRW